MAYVNEQEREMANLLASHLGLSTSKLVQIMLKNRWEQVFGHATVDQVSKLVQK